MLRTSSIHVFDHFDLYLTPVTQLRSRHHHRHHKRQPGEQQFPIQVVTG